MKRIGVAILGYGFMGTTHLAAWKMMDDCRVLGLWGRDKSRLNDVASKYGVRPYESFSQIIDDKDVDVVDICTPTYTHRKLAVEAMEAGKHVIVEKPMALNLEEADDMISTSRRTGVKLMVAHVLRFFPEYMKAKDLIDQGLLGELAVIRAWRGGPAPEWSPWFMDLGKSGGVTVDLAIHDVDFAIWINGCMPSEVYAKVANLVHKSHDIHDYALIALKFPTGCIALLEANWALPKSYPFTMKLEVDGTKGMIHLDNQSPTPLRLWTESGVEGFSPETLPWKPGVHPFPLDPFYREIRHFVECIKEDRMPITDGVEARKSLEICLAAMRSAAENHPIRIGG
jgi:predicted dehydrogenase